MITIIEDGTERKYFPVNSNVLGTNLESYTLTQIPTEDIKTRFDNARFGRIALSLQIIKGANPQIPFNNLAQLTNHERSFLVGRIFNIPGFQASTLNSEHFYFRYFHQFETIVINPNIHLKGQYTDRTASIQQFSNLIDNYSVYDWKAVSENILNNFSLDTRTATLTALKVYKTDDDYEPGFVALLKGMGDSVLANLIALDLGSEFSLRHGWIWGNEYSIFPHFAKAAMMEIYRHGMELKPECLAMFLNNGGDPLSMVWLYQNPYKPQSDRTNQIFISVPKNQIPIPITHPKPSLSH